MAGVATVPSGFISDSIKVAVDSTLKDVQPGHGTAVIQVDLSKGANLVVVHRFAPKGDWNMDAALYVGKNWEHGAQIGGFIKASW
jgi:hypothetical protein